jgi:predicted secreted protein
MLKNLIRSTTILMLASTPILTSSMLSFIYNVNSQDIYKELRHSLLICALIYSIISLSRILFLFDRSRIVFQPWVHFFHAGTLFLVLLVNLFLNLTQLEGHQSAFSLSPITMPYNRWSKFTAIIYIVSIINYFLVEVVLSKVEQAELGRVDVSEAVIIDTKTYLNAARWLLMPCLISAVITLLTYLLSGYESSIVNHAGIFGVYLAIAIVFKEKVISKQKSP